MSVADISIVPLQDLLGLDSTARMNTPGRATGNWSWRLEEGALTAELCTRLRETTDTYGRSPSVAEVPVASGPIRRLPRGDPRAPQA